jgi:hypothetical protein
MLYDSGFDKTIDSQIKNIAATGATHVSIATPYDEEFYPILFRWVSAARKYKLKVWFRGNLSGWEEWFGYPRIGRQEHIEKTAMFIKTHPGIFKDGDIFSSCPECENGGPGDPRTNNDIEGFRNFLIEEHNAVKSSFKYIKKDVITNYFSMNGDVAIQVMDKKTTKALGGIVTVDHYVKTPEILLSDIKVFAKSSGGKIVLGEFGAPIPDIHEEMTAEEKARWISQALSGMEKTGEVAGVNYWLNVGGTTGIWSVNNEANPAVKEITKYYKPDVYYGLVIDELGKAVSNPVVTVGSKKITGGSDGYFEFSYVGDIPAITISAPDFKSRYFKPAVKNAQTNVILVKIDKNILYQTKALLNKTVGK